VNSSEALSALGKAGEVVIEERAPDLEKKLNSMVQELQKKLQEVRERALKELDVKPQQNPAPAPVKPQPKRPLQFI